jgi:hypothetical protein
VVVIIDMVDIVVVVVVTAIIGAEYSGAFFD